LLWRPFYEEDFLLRRIDIFPAFRFVWQFLLKNRRHRGDADAGVLGIFRQRRRSATIAQS
jgi:hypothetical protein